MKVSLNWIKEYTKVDLPVDDLVAKIGSQIGAVDEVTDLGKKYEGILVALVVECESHPNADKLSVCKIDDGGKAKGVKRDKDGHIQVVCGAPNVRKGMLVAWCPPGVVVPSTYDKDQFKLDARDIRGVTSFGMLASASELGFSDNHEGILELDKSMAKVGKTFAETFWLNDYIIDIENKMFTHRPDCFGLLGVAREIAGITGQGFKSPDWYLKPSNLKPKTSNLALKVENQLAKQCPRFMAVAINGVKVGSSPAWLQSFLSRVGMRPINNIVDMTNYYMYLTGQPLHAYDYDKIAGGTLVVRAPKKGEKITLLGGKTFELKTNDIVIADKEQAVGLGGVMGGADSEVSESTTRIILECANFDKYSIHKTAMEHGLFTDAVTRFSKGQSPLQLPAVIAKTAEHITEICGGQIASDTEDKGAADSGQRTVKTAVDFINSRLGLDLKASEVKTLLENVEFKVQVTGDKLKIDAPFWRTDIEIPEDIVEEVGRLYGFDKLPTELPKHDITPAPANPMLQLKAQIRQILASAGANELLTYNFIHGDLMQKVGQEPKEAFKIANAISPDLQYYRTSLVPGLLEKIHPNIKAGNDEFALFELGRAHHKDLIGKDKLPEEDDRLAFVYAVNDKLAKAGYSGAPYYQAAKYLTHLLGKLGIRPNFVPFAGKDYKSKALSSAMAPYAPERAAFVQNQDGELIGLIGEFNPSVSSSLKLPNFTAGFELSAEQLLKLSDAGSPYVVQPKFPKTEQDICLRVNQDITYSQLFDFAWDELVKIQPANVFATLEPVDIYEKDKTHKQITLRLKIASYERTLEAQTVNGLLDTIAQAAKSKLKAERV